MIIGGGKVGFHKATILSRFTTQATVISPIFHKGFENLSFTLIQKQYESKDIEGAFLIYICTENQNLNAQIKADALKLNVLASVCDSPILCDFISPAIYKNENVTIAVSSNALNVHQSIDIRNQINDLVNDGSISLDTKNR